MEAFKEWWRKLPFDEQPHLDPFGYNFAKLGWQAALEWVNKVCEEYEEDWDHSISDTIKEELGEINAGK